MNEITKIVEIQIEKLKEILKSKKISLDITDKAGRFWQKKGLILFMEQGC